MPLNKQQKKQLPIAGLFFSLFMMAFGSYGSFDPTESGFYLSLLAGFIWVLGFGYLLDKYQRK